MKAKLSTGGPSRRSLLAAGLAMPAVLNLPRGAQAQVANDRDWASQYFPSVQRAKVSGFAR